VARGEIVLGISAHILSTDTTGEFDPFYVERMKNALLLMLNKEFVGQLEDEMEANTISVKKGRDEPGERKVGDKYSDSRGKIPNRVEPDPSVPFQVNEFVQRSGTGVGLRK